MTNLQWVQAVFPDAYATLLVEETSHTFAVWDRDQGHPDAVILGVGMMPHLAWEDAARRYAPSPEAK